MRCPGACRHIEAVSRTTPHETERKKLLSALSHHWIGPLPLEWNGEILDGRKRLTLWDDMGRERPELVRPPTIVGCVCELAERGHFDRARELLDRSELADCSVSELQRATGLGLAKARAVVKARETATTTRSYRRTVIIVRKLRELLTAHDDEGHPITAEDLRSILKLWDDVRSTG